MSEVKNQLKLSREAEAAFRVEPKTFFCLFSETRKNRQNPKTRSTFFLKVEDLGGGDNDEDDDDDDNYDVAKTRCVYNWPKLWAMKNVFSKTNNVKSA